MKIKTKKRSNICPCQSSLSYAKCCKPLHTGKADADSPDSLMRSRYSAYVKGEIDYLINTTDKTGPLWRDDVEVWKAELAEFSQETHFQGLEILSVGANAVRFEATLEIEGKDASFIETSLFTTYDDKWYYHSGEFE